MRKRCLPTLAGIIIGGLVMTSSGIVEAALITGTRFAVSLGNVLEPNRTYLAQVESLTDTMSVDGLYSRDFTGVTSAFCEESECFEELGTMTLSGNGQASSANGVLKASASATVENPVQLSDFDNTYQNDPYVIDTDFNVDESGIPESIRVMSVATFSDTFTVAGASDLTSVRVQFQLTGEIAKEKSAWPAFALVGQDTQGQYALGASNYIGIVSLSGVYNTTIFSDPINVDGGFADLSFGLYTQVTFDIYNLFGSGPYEATVDFFSTLAIQDIVGLNENGEEVFLSNATGSDGTIFVNRQGQQPSTVPVPPTLALLGAGLVGLCLMRRRRSTS